MLFGRMVLGDWYVYLDWTFESALMIWEPLPTYICIFFLVTMNNVSSVALTLML